MSPEIAAKSDAELVEWSRSGDRSAFAAIVKRYQRLVCSITYNATGSLSLSEDLAQETFFAAWKQMAELREPERLRAWLCGIARFLVGKEFRKMGREPAHAAEALDSIEEPQSAEASPAMQAVSREEEAILWRALERIPDTYREPLILFYREEKSIERVAAELELSEDAVKQRLSRGRKLLHEEVVAFVEGTLSRTAPGQNFSNAVLAMLPAASAATWERAWRAKARRWPRVGRWACVAGAVDAVCGRVCRVDGELDFSTVSADGARATVPGLVAHLLLDFRAGLVLGWAICGASTAARIRMERREVFRGGGGLLVVLRDGGGGVSRLVSPAGCGDATTDCAGARKAGEQRSAFDGCVEDCDRGGDLCGDVFRDDLSGVQRTRLAGRCNSSGGDDCAGRMATALHEEP
jgi:RNA polymerase sigma factor (sigma-70 family)